MSLAWAIRKAARSTASPRKAFLLIGQCVPCIKENVSKVKVRHLDLDTNLNMYFKTDEFYHAVDPGKKCKSGDIVLIQELPDKVTKLITHKVVEIVHKLGDVTDPLTGKKVSQTTFRDDIEKVRELYGKTDSAFEYEKAPPRGRLEGVRDMTDKDTYLKYHNFPKEDPYAI